MALVDPEALPTPRRWVTKQEAAEHIGVSVRTIGIMLADGRLRGYRVGGAGAKTRMVRLDLVEVDDAMRPCGGDAA